MEKEEAKRKLLDLMQDTESFELLSKWSNKVNIFDVLKISRMEIRHSNVLGWLLNPNENHGIGDSFLYRLLNLLSENLDVDKSLKILSSDLFSYRVLREWNSIDILFVSDKDKIVIAIENKIGSHEHKRNNSEESQLNVYQSIISQNFSSYDSIFVYLTPEGEIPSNNSWIIVTYSDILNILSKLYEEKKKALKEEVNLLIKNYIDNLKNNVIMDQELIELCNKIYIKHKDALDLIYENRDDSASRISNLFRSILKERNIESDDSNTKCNIRFRTDKLKSYFNGLNLDHYFYQFQIRPKEDYMILELVYHKWKNEELDQSIIEKMNKLLHKTKQLKDDWEWKRAWSKKIVDISSKSEDELKSAINECLDELENKEKTWNL